MLRRTVYPHPSHCTLTCQKIVNKQIAHLDQSIVVFVFLLENAKLGARTVYFEKPFGTQTGIAFLKLLFTEFLLLKLDFLEKQ